MTDDERALLILVAEAVAILGKSDLEICRLRELGLLPSIVPIRELAAKIKDAPEAVDPPKLPIRVGTVVKFNAAISATLPKRGMSRASGVVTGSSGNSRLVACFGSGPSIWAREDQLTAVEVEVDDDYRKRIIEECKDRFPKRGQLFDSTVDVVNSASGAKLDEYGQSVGVTRRGTEGAAP